MARIILVAILVLPIVSATSYKCNREVGIGNGQIPDSSLTDSSHYSRFQTASEGRLNNAKSSTGIGAWCAKREDVENGTAYMQVDLGSTLLLGKLRTQGRNTTYAQYVDKYRVSYSTDDVSYTFIKDATTNKHKIFIGNSDKNTIVTRGIRSSPGVPLQARYIRVHPVSFYSNPCMRIELKSCHLIVTCSSGYKLASDNKTCEDINECTEGGSKCDLFSTKCLNNKGGYTCQCKPGFRSDPSSTYRCSDIDECTEKDHGCAQKCHNMQGTYTCSCNAGYTLNPDGRTCTDINECSTLNPSHHCDSKTTTCSNTDGGYRCDCISGYVRNDFYSCKDKDECHNGESKCDLVSSYCINSPGKYACLCRGGYERPQGVPFDDYRCQDVDECAYRNGSCSDGCQNLQGTYLCTCPAGYELSSQDNRKCVDINECMLGNGNCEHNCQNTLGSYTCSCKAGFRQDGKYKCIDINECTDGSSKCDSVTTDCQNNQPFYQCNCKTGFRPIPGDSYKCEAKVCPVLSVAAGTVVSPQGCTENGGAYVNIVCTFSCQAGYQLPDANTSTITCLDSSRWSSVPISCQKKSCPALTAPANGKVFPDFCAIRGNQYTGTCYYQCNSGYVGDGTSSRTCEATGTWSTTQKEFRCNKVYPRPTITCPADVSTTLSAGAATADVSALLDAPTSNVQPISISPTKYQDFYIFPAGSTELTYTATNQNGESVSCTTLVTVIDDEKPKITGCPSDIFKIISTTSAVVSWTPPNMTDNVGVVHQSATKNPGDVFSAGGQINVVYTARDARGNVAECSFKVTLKKAECEDPPQPEGGTLTISSFGDVKFGNIVCNQGKKLFQKTWSSVYCNPTTSLKWPVIPDCVDFIQKSSSACPQGMVNQTSLVASPPDNICVKCPKGMFYRISTTSCVTCLVGHYSTAEGSLSCSACPSATSTMKPGSKSCTALCGPGTFSATGFDLPTQSQGCEKCRRGKYEDRAGSTGCKMCPAGQTTLILGSRAMADCGGAPSISEFMSTPVNVTENQLVDMICRGSGVPTPTFKVIKVKPAPDGFGGPVTKTVILDANSKMAGLKYTITKATEHDAGYFICEVENSFGLAKQYYHLNVHLIIGDGRRR